MKIATWNVNSIRTRLDHVVQLVNTEKIDILCLQETKVVDQSFPIKIFNKLGYCHNHYNGAKSYNGVAILSKIPINLVETNIPLEKSRAISVYLPSLDAQLYNLYMDAGGYEPDPEINEKFKKKLLSLGNMEYYFQNYHNNKERVILLGDLNVAPHENDVWSHKPMLNVVSHTPIEVELFNKFKNSINFSDIGRKFVPLEQKLFSWWSYRNVDWQKSNRGRRLDHIWTTKALESHVKSFKIIKETRNWTRPSDHVPIIIEMKL